MVRGLIAGSTICHEACIYLQMNIASYKDRPTKQIPEQLRLQYSDVSNYGTLQMSSLTVTPWTDIHGRVSESCGIALPEGKVISWGAVRAVAQRRGGNHFRHRELSFLHVSLHCAHEVGMRANSAPSIERAL